MREIAKRAIEMLHVGRPTSFLRPTGRHQSLWLIALPSKVIIQDNTDGVVLVKIHYCLSSMPVTLEYTTFYLILLHLLLPSVRTFRSPTFKIIITLDR